MKRAEMIAKLLEQDREDMHKDHGWDWIKMMLLDGCRGYHNMGDQELAEEYNVRIDDVTYDENSNTWLG